MSLCTQTVHRLGLRPELTHGWRNPSSGESNLRCHAEWAAQQDVAFVTSRLLSETGCDGDQGGLFLQLALTRPGAIAADDAHSDEITEISGAAMS